MRTPTFHIERQGKEFVNKDGQRKYKIRRPCMDLRMCSSKERSEGRQVRK